jgi:signal transduction histidine kinase
VDATADPVMSQPGTWQHRDQLLDVALAMALTAVTIASLLTPQPTVGFRQPSAWLVPVALVAGLPLAVRRRWPVAVLLSALAADTTLAWYGWEPDPAAVCVLFALYAVAAWRPLRISVSCLVLVYASIAVVTVLRAPPSYSRESLPTMPVFVVAWSLGFFVRRWRHAQHAALARTIEAEGSRAAAAEQASFAERLWIAQELHDVISHTLSGIAVQAAVARHLITVQPAKAAPALGEIEQASRSALDDLRRMLGVLRNTPPSWAEGTGPAPVSPSLLRPVLPGLLLDLLLGLAITAAAVSSVLSPDPTDAYHWPAPNAWLVLLAVAASLPLTVRRRWPAATLVVMLAATTTIAALRWNPGALPPCVIIALYTVSAWRPRAVALAALAFTYAALGLLTVLRAPYFDGPLVLVTVTAFTTVWFFGRYARHRRTAEQTAAARAVQAEHDRAATAERAVLAERLRIARELHDVVSHTLSVIAVQSGVAHHLINVQPEKAAPALDAIETAGRTALDDLRHMLGVLHTDPQAPPAALAPTPGLDELELLASAHRAAYGPIELTVDPAVESAPESLRVTVYRLVQEALTNARKHAPGSPVRVCVQAGEEDVTVQVDDDGPSPPSPQPSSGYGLTGMSERVAMYQGTLHAGPRPTGGFRVHATLRTRAEHVQALP